jgi:simple sugar transport system ATP-binding protein
MSAPNLLELHNISKSFGALTALRDLSFHVGPRRSRRSSRRQRRREVDDRQPDFGHSQADRRPSERRRTKDGVYLPVRFSRCRYRNHLPEHGLVDSLSITRNIFMGRERTTALGFLKQAEMRDIAMEVLEKAVHISGIDSPDKLVGDLSGGQKQAVAIARAVFFKRRVLLLDEPTSALSVRETEALLAQVLKLKAEGVSSVLVTHNLYHAYQVCDRFVIMSHGTKVFDVNKADTSISQLTEYVVLT